MMVSYCDKTKSRMKNVIILTIMHDVVRTTKDEQTKPDVHKMYDFTKGGADAVLLIAKKGPKRDRKGTEKDRKGTEKGPKRDRKGTEKGPKRDRKGTEKGPKRDRKGIEKDRYRI